MEHGATHTLPHHALQASQKATITHRRKQPPHTPASSAAPLLSPATAGGVLAQMLLDRPVARSQLLHSSGALPCNGPFHIPTPRLRLHSNRHQGQPQFFMQAAPYGPPARTLDATTSSLQICHANLAFMPMCISPPRAALWTCPNQR